MSSGNNDSHQRYRNADDMGMPPGDAAEKIRGGQPPPELPQFAALRAMLRGSALQMSMTADAIQELNKVGQLPAFDAQARQIYDMARWLVMHISGVYTTAIIVQALPPPDTKPAIGQLP